MSEPMELTYRQFDSFIDTAEENTPDNPYYIKITNNITSNIIDGVDREIYYKLIINKTETTSGLPISFQANPNLVGLEVIGDNLSHSAEKLCLNCKNLKSVKFGINCILSNLSFAFSDCSNLISVELPYNCLQEIKSMEGIFAGCTSLKDIDFNILNYCSNINDAFSRCVSLSGEINLLFNRHSKYNLRDIFSGCENISAAQITVENSYLYGNVMFENCYSLEKININLTESIVNIGMLGTVNDKYKNCKCNVVCNDTYSGTNIFYEFTDLKTQYGTGMTSLYRIDIGSSNSKLKNLELSVFNESVSEVYFRSPINNVSLNFNNIENYRGASINLEYIAYVKKLSVYNVKALIYYEDLKDSNKNYYSYLEDLYFENCELNFSSFIMDHSNTSVKSFIGTGLRNYSFFPRFENFKSLKTVKANYRFVDDNNNLINTPALYIQYSFQECINLEEVLITCDNPELHVGVMDTFINCRSLTSFRFPPNAVSFSGENFSDGVGLKILEVTKGILSSQFVKYSLEQLNLEHLIVDMKNQAWDTNFNKFKLAPKITLKNLGGNDVAWKEKYNNKYIKLVVSSNSIQTFHTHVNSLTKDSFVLCPNLKALKLEGYLDQNSSLITDGDISTTGNIYSKDKLVILDDGTNSTLKGTSVQLSKLGNGDSNITDNTDLITSHINGYSTTNSSFYKRKASYLWNYIKDKLSSVFKINTWVIFSTHRYVASETPTTTYYWRRLGVWNPYAKDTLYYNSNDSTDDNFEFEIIGDSNYPYFGHYILRVSKYLKTSISLKLECLGGSSAAQLAVAVDANGVVYFQANATWQNRSRIRVISGNGRFNTIDSLNDVGYSTFGTASGFTALRIIKNNGAEKYVFSNSGVLSYNSFYPSIMYGAVSTEPNQGLSDTEKSNARLNIGLNNVNNTSDENKPISTATQTALNNKMNLNNPTGLGSFSLNRKNSTEVGGNSVAIGNSCTAEGDISYAEGNNTIAGGAVSHAEGNNTLAGGAVSHAEGNNTLAGGAVSHAEGDGALARGEASHAEGISWVSLYNNTEVVASTVADGMGAHAEGQATEAIGDYSHTEGNGIVYGVPGNPEPQYYKTTARGEASHAEGHGTVANGNYQHVQGKFNVIDNDNKFADIVGGGTIGWKTSEGIQMIGFKNIEATDWSGNKYLTGNVYVQCEDNSSGGKMLVPSGAIDVKSRVKLTPNNSASSATVTITDHQAYLVNGMLNLTVHFRTTSNATATNTTIITLDAPSLGLPANITQYKCVASAVSFYGATYMSIHYNTDNVGSFKIRWHGSLNSGNACTFPINIPVPIIPV